MNNTRRKALTALKEKIEDIRSEIEALMEEEEDYHDNMPENLQGSERYEKADNACDALSDALTSLEDATDSIDAAVE